MKNSVATFFDKYAVDFDSIYGPQNNFFDKFINEHFRKCMKIRFIKTIEGCSPVDGKSVIDIGCGAGQYVRALVKKGAGYVYGIDFAQGMIDLARKNAVCDGIESKCKFDLVDFLADPIPGTFDYAVVMGFMDYMKEPKAVVKKVLSFTTSRAFFSFPANGGILAWQRKLRYLHRCPLFLYDKKKIYSIFKGLLYKDLMVEKIGRDFFVTVCL